MSRDAGSGTAVATGTITEPIAALVLPSLPPPFWVSSELQRPLMLDPVNELVAEKPEMVDGPTAPSAA